MTPKQEKALAALLTYPTKEKAAAAAGISSKTLRRYLEDSEFQERYKAAFSELVGNATDMAKQGLTPALACLREIIEDKGCSSQARVQAARTLLEYGMKFTEMSDILERIAALERFNGDGN